MKIKYKLFCFFVISFFALPVWAKCPDMGTPQLNIRFKYGEIHYINNKSSRDFPQAPASDVTGLTVTNLQRTATGDAVMGRSNGSYCVMLGNLNVEIGFPRVDIYIDKKYQPGSCNYNVIKEHEEYHARVQQEGLKFFAAKIKQAYQTALKKIKPQETYSASLAQDIAAKMVGQVEKDVLPLMKYVEQQLYEKNMVIDTSESYAKEAKRCPKW